MWCFSIGTPVNIEACAGRVMEGVMVWAVQVQAPSFSSTAHVCEGVFETLNMITRMLLNKYISQGTPQYA